MKRRSEEGTKQNERLLVSWGNRSSALSARGAGLAKSFLLAMTLSLPFNSSCCPGGSGGMRRSKTYPGSACGCIPQSSVAPKMCQSLPPPSTPGENQSELCQLHQELGRASKMTEGDGANSNFSTLPKSTTLPSTGRADRGHG